MSYSSGGARGINNLNREIREQKQEGVFATRVAHYFPMAHPRTSINSAAKSSRVSVRRDH